MHPLVLWPLIHNFFNIQIQQLHHNTAPYVSKFAWVTWEVEGCGCLWVHHILLSLFLIPYIQSQPNNAYLVFYIYQVYIEGL